MALVYPLKNYDPGQYEGPVDTSVDQLVACGFYPQNSGTPDLNVGIEREAGTGKLILKTASTNISLRIGGSEYAWLDTTGQWNANKLAAVNNLYSPNHDTASGVALTIGGTNATSIVLGRAGVTVGVPGMLGVGGQQVLYLPSNNPEVGPWNPIWSAIRQGRRLYTDEEFVGGSNSVGVYNGMGGDGVVITRMTAATAGVGAPNGSGYVLEIRHNGNTTSPAYGGFVQGIAARRNATFAQVFRAKMPAGYTLNIAENPQGTNNTSYWLSSNVGTGKWEEYVRVSHCGHTGTFSSGGHVYVAGSPAPTSGANLVWYLASCTVYDATDVRQGLGSGLDADMLDGHDTSYFQVALGFTPPPNTRQVIAGAGLTGGGALSADVTLNVIAHADGSIVVAADSIQVGVLATDAQHGTRGGGTLHAAVIAAGAAGFMSGADKTKLDGIATGAQVNDTAAQILAKLITVDGAGSGLDADLLDGLHAVSFASGVAAVSQTNFDLIKQPGLYQYDGALTGTLPPLGMANFRTIEVGNANRYSQIALPWFEDGLCTRHNKDGVWSAWRTVWHDGNLVGDRSNTQGFLTTTAASRLADLNSPPYGFSYWDSTSTNRPYGYGTLLSWAYGGTGMTAAAGNWLFELGISTDATPRLVFRHNINGNGWSSWCEAWTNQTLTNLSQLANGPGYITSVAGALGYTPVNKAGDTMTGPLTVTAPGSALASEAWIALTLINSWVNYDTAAYAPASCYKDSCGVVHLRGMIKNGTLNSNVAILPSGHRPSAKLMFAAQTYLAVSPYIAIAAISTDYDGTVYVGVGANSTFVSLDGISFRAEP